MNESIVIEPVTARSSPEIRDDLVVLLKETVNGGDTVGFLPPLSTDEAAAFWDEVREALEVIKLLVHREARRQGLGQKLMGAVETVGRGEGRTLLVLDTRQGEPSEAFYAASGYQRAGVIPNFARSEDGTLHSTVLFYKEL